MYTHEFQGKNIYTKLGDVIELKRKENYNDSGASVKKSSMVVLSKTVSSSKNKIEEKNFAKSKSLNYSIR